MRSLGETVEDVPEEWLHRSVTQIFDDKLINRAPAKIVDYQNGYLLLANGSLITYANVEDHQVETLEESNGVIEATIESKALDTIELSRNFRIIALQDLGVANEADLSCLVLEELDSRQIRFLQI